MYVWRWLVLLLAVWTATTALSPISGRSHSVDAGASVTCPASGGDNDALRAEEARGTFFIADQQPAIDADLPPGWTWKSHRDSVDSKAAAGTVVLFSWLTTRARGLAAPRGPPASV